MFSEYLLSILEAEAEKKVTKAVEKYDDVCWQGPGEDLENRDNDLKQFTDTQLKKIKNKKLKSKVEKKVLDKLNIGKEE